MKGAPVQNRAIDKYSPRLVAISAITLALVLDLAISRAFVLGRAGMDGTTLIPGLLDIHYMWNRGISFSFFWQSNAWGSFALSLCILGLTVAVLVYALRTERPLLAGALGLIVGGASGNLIDRLLYNAVFDFLFVHIGTIRLFVCNIGDIFISCGFLGVAADALLPTTERPVGENSSNAN
jgi:signal peptidase II